MARCPNCNNELKKEPQKKTKCPFCNEYMYVKIDPNTQERVIVTKSKADIIDEQWRIIRSVSVCWDEIVIGLSDEQIKKKKKELHERFGYEPADADVVWGIFNDQLAEYGSNWDFGHYSTVRCRMALLLQYEEKLIDALRTYCEVLYFDQNGANNAGHIKSIENLKLRKELLNEYPPFNIKHSMCPPAILERVIAIMKYLNLDIQELRRIYIEHNTEVFNEIKIIPLKPEICWQRLEEKINETQNNNL